MTGVIDAAVKRLMTDESVHGCLLAINHTSLLVEEQVARYLPASSSTSSIPPEAFSKIQAEVMRKMVVVAEDAEGVGRWLVSHPYFRKRQAAEDLAQYEGMLNSRLVPRLVLAVSAAVLHGWRPLDDPFFGLLVLAYASGSLTKQLAGNVLTLMEKTLLGQNFIKDDVLMESLPDIWQTNDSTEEIGQGLFRLFEALERRGGNVYSRGNDHHRRRTNSGGPAAVQDSSSSSTSLSTSSAPFRTSRKGLALLILVNLVHFVRTYWKEVATGVIGAIIILMIVNLAGY